MSSGSSKGKADLIGAVEIIVGAIMDWYTGGSGNALIMMGAATILENLLTPNPVTQGMQSVLRSSVANQTIVYGQAQTGGTLMFGSSYGSNGSATNAFMTVCVNHSLTRANSAGTGGMPIQGIEGFFLNDVYIPVNLNNGQGGWNAGRGADSGTGVCAIIGGMIDGSNAPYNTLAGNLWISFSDGSQTSVDPIFNNFTVPAHFVGYGCAYSTWVMFQSADPGTFSAAFPNGIQTPTSIRALINGQLIYDPRLDSTNGGTGSQRLNDTTTWTFSSNPALCLADYLTRAKTDGGGGYGNNQINWTDVAAAANVCDTNITVPQLGATWSGTAWSATETISQYSFNCALSTGVSVDQNVQTILKSMAGWLTVQGGLICISAGAPTIPDSVTLDETFLAGEVQLTNQVARNQMWNAVKFTYGAEPDADYNPGQGQPIITPAYESQDGNVRLWIQDTIPGCNNQWQCQILEIIKSRQSRNKMRLQLNCNMKAIQFAGGDVVNVNLPELGLTNSPFRIVHMSIASDYKIAVSLIQENANTYVIPQPPDATFQPFNTATYQELYSLTPPVPPAPTNVTAVGLPSGILLQWTPPPANLYQYQEIYRSTSPSSGYSMVAASVSGDSWVDTDTVSGTTYYYYIVAVQPYNGTATEMSFVGTPETYMAYAASIQGPSSPDLPNVIGTTANFNVTAVGWYEIAISDNAQFADYRCSFTATAAVTNGATQGTCHFTVSNDSTGAQVHLVADGPKGIPITQCRVRTDGSDHTALDIYINWQSGTNAISVAVSPVTGPWNGVAAQAGLSASAGTVQQVINFDPFATGYHGGGWGTVGPGGTWHLLLDSGDVYHGGTHIAQGGVLDQNNVSIGGRIEKIGTTAQHLTPTGQLDTADNVAADGTFLRLSPIRSGTDSDIDNGDFESWANGIPLGWSINGSLVAAHAPAQVVQNTSPYSGKYCAQIITTSGASYQGIVATKTFPVKAGQTVYLEGAIKSDGTNSVQLMVWYGDVNGNYVNNYSATSTSTTSWAFGSYIGQVPANAVTAFVATASGANTPAFSYFVDAVKFVSGSATAVLPSGLKAYVNASDTTPGGHSGTWQHSFMSTGVQAAVTSGGSLVQVCDALNNTEQGTAFDGSAITFINSYSTVPMVLYLPGGLTYDSTLPAGAQQQVFTVGSLTATGFTPSLKIQNLPSSSTNETVNFSPYNSLTSSATATLTVPGGDTVLNGAFTVNFSVVVPAEGSDTVTVKIAGTTEWTRNFSVANAKTYNFNLQVTNIAAVNGSTVGVSDTGGYIKATTVTYQVGTATTTHTATPTGSQGVPFIVLPPQS